MNKKITMHQKLQVFYISKEETNCPIIIEIIKIRIPNTFSAFFDCISASLFSLLISVHHAFFLLSDLHKEYTYVILPP